jgi:hypothetical protein
MPFAEPDPHAVRELALERLSAGPVETDGADRRFHRNAASFVERRKSCHAARLPGPCGTGPCPAVASPCRISKWHTRRLSVGMHSPRRPRRTSHEVKKRLPTTPALLQASNWHPLRMPIGPDHASPEKPAAAPLADTHSLDLARGLPGSATRGLRQLAYPSSANCICRNGGRRVGLPSLVGGLSARLGQLASAASATWRRTPRHAADQVADPTHPEDVQRLLPAHRGYHPSRAGSII